MNRLIEDTGGNFNLDRRPRADSTRFPWEDEAMIDNNWLRGVEDWCEADCRYGGYMGINQAKMSIWSKDSWGDEILTPQGLRDGDQPHCDILKRWVNVEDCSEEDLGMLGETDEERWGKMCDDEWIAPAGRRLENAAYKLLCTLGYGHTPPNETNPINAGGVSLPNEITDQMVGLTQAYVKRGNVVSLINIFAKSINNGFNRDDARTCLLILDFCERLAQVLSEDGDRITVAYDTKVRVVKESLKDNSTSWLWEKLGAVMLEEKRFEESRKYWKNRLD